MDELNGRVSGICLHFEATNIREESGAVKMAFEGVATRFLEESGFDRSNQRAHSIEELANMSC